MTSLTRRRFLAISAGASALALVSGPVPAFATGETPLTSWQGMALGARARITLAHPESERIMAMVRAELQRLEGIFSLYRSDSALSRLNRDGRLGAPAPELLDCLSIAGALNHATGGAFDPTVQPLWVAHAKAHAAGHAPVPEALEAARALTGWSAVRLDTSEIVLLRKSAALTLNGIAQGYIADRIAALLKAEGLSDVMIDTGELRALGSNPDGSDWDVTLANGRGHTTLRDMALATSAPLGTAFDPAGTVGHILDPRTGRPAASGWSQVSVSASSAAVADGLSTAFCLMQRSEMETALQLVGGARLIDLS